MTKVLGKMLKKSVKSVKEVVEDSKEDIKSMSTNMAEAQEKSIEIKARAIKKGLTENENNFCKHCGKTIDTDSKFCSKCGKEL